MKPRRVQVSHGKDGFTLSVEEYSRFRSLVASVGDSFCAMTGHRWCNAGVVAWSMNQDWDHSKELVKVSIDRETAEKLSQKDSWSWLDNDDDES